MSITPQPLHHYVSSLCVPGRRLDLGWEGASGRSPGQHLRQASVRRVPCPPPRDSSVLPGPALASQVPVPPHVGPLFPSPQPVSTFMTADRPRPRGARRLCEEVNSVAVAFTSHLWIAHSEAKIWATASQELETLSPATRCCQGSHRLDRGNSWQPATGLGAESVPGSPRVSGLVDTLGSSLQHPILRWGKPRPRNRRYV